jgi:hypothetical protein
VLTKIQRFAASPTVQRIVSRPESTISFLDLIAEGSILLVDLPAGTTGQDNTGFLGSLLLSYLRRSGHTAAKVPTRTASWPTTGSPSSGAYGWTRSSMTKPFISEISLPIARGSPKLQ